MKTVITIFGLPGSGKTTVANAVHKILGGSRINADTMRSTISPDLKFSDDDRAIQAWRMGRLAAISLAEPPTVVSGENLWNLNAIAVVDFVNPTERTRRTYDWAIKSELPFPVKHFKVWMDTITPAQSRFADTARLFEPPPPTQVMLSVKGFKTPSELEVVAESIAWHIRNG